MPRPKSKLTQAEESRRLKAWLDRRGHGRTCWTARRKQNRTKKGTK